MVELDSPEGIDIDTCAAITRRIEEVFDRDKEDYSLEVGSAGLTSPFKVKGQYEKTSAIKSRCSLKTAGNRKVHSSLWAMTTLQ